MRAKTSESRSGAATRRALAAGLVLASAALSFPASHAASRDIVLMLDNSGSMRANDPEFLTSVAVRTFLDGLEGDNRVAIVSFDERVDVLMPLTVLDDETRASFLSSLDAITYAGRLTNSPAALERSLYELRTAARPEAEKSIIFMTDGIVDIAPEGPDDGDLEKGRWMKSTLVEEAVDSQVRIYGIAFTDSADYELIQTLAKRTGGEYYRAYSTAEIEGVFRDLRHHLLAERAPPQPPAAPDEAPAAPDEAPADTLPAPSADATTGPEADDAPEIPASVLPEVDLPTVTLPEAGTAGDAVSPPAPAPAPGGKAQRVPAPLPPAPPVAPRPAPPVAAAPPAEDSQLWLVLLAGGLALVLALVALLRRRPSAQAGGADALMPKAVLNDIDGVTEQHSYELDAKPTIVGRIMGLDPNAAHYVVIDESTIGRRHALLEYREHSFWVADQSSLNGTFVNNARIEAPTRLKHGDRIRFHKHEFEFLVHDMLETDRTMMSNTVYADLPADGGPGAMGQDHSTVVREGEGDPDSPQPPRSPEDPTVTRR